MKTLTDPGTKKGGAYKGESPDLNLIRHHINSTHKGIEIASEQGFSGEQNKARTLLRPNKSYNIEIKITSDNFLPKKKKFVFNPDSGDLTKK